MWKCSTIGLMSLASHSLIRITLLLLVMLHCFSTTAAVAGGRRREDKEEEVVVATAVGLADQQHCTPIDGKPCSCQYGDQVVDLLAGGLQAQIP